MVVINDSTPHVDFIFTIFVQYLHELVVRRIGPEQHAHPVHAHLCSKKIVIPA